MKKIKTYDWSKLPPPENQFKVTMTPKQERRVNLCVKKLVDLWGIDAETALQEILSVRADYAFTRLYLTGNDKKIQAQKELSEVHRLLSEGHGIKLSIGGTPFQSQYIQTKLRAFLIGLPDPGLEKTNRGRPKGRSSTIEINYIVRTRNERYEPIITGIRDRYYFIGTLLTGAGVFYNKTLEEILNPNLLDQGKDYLFNKVKKLL